MVTYDYVGEPWKDWFFLILQAIFDLTVIIIFIVWITKMKISKLNDNNNNSHTNRKFFIISCIICYTFIILCLTAIIFRMYGRYMIHEQGFYKIQVTEILDWSDIIHLMVHGFHYLSFIMLYVIFLGRLYLTFKNSMYSITNDKYFLFFIFIFLVSTLSIMTWLEISYSNIIDRNNEHYDKSKKYLTRAYLKWTLAVFDIILNLILFFTFQKKIKQLLLSTYDSSMYNDYMNMDDNDNNSVNSSLIELHENQQRLLKFITKHAVLFSLTIIFNEIYWILSGIVDFITATQGDNDKHKEIDIYTYFCQGIQGVILSIILYLIFAINQREYNKLCSFCQRLFYNYFVINTKTQIKQLVNLKLSQKRLNLNSNSDK